MRPSVVVSILLLLSACDSGSTSGNGGEGEPVPDEDTWRSEGDGGGKDVIRGEDIAACIPNCNGKFCGDDGCGGSCGECAEGATCLDGGVCDDGCVPDCGTKECGADGCGGSCGECPGGGLCLDGGVCQDVCVPDCYGPDGPKECGADGCGGSCGDCQPGYGCEEGGCVKVCVPDCDGKDCGDDGCGGNCGDCQPGYGCEEGGCVKVCAPDCDGKDCGDDGCGGSCGTCKPWETCTAAQCVDGCVPGCGGKVCGPDGCGGSCGICPCVGCDPNATDCANGQCVEPAGGLTCTGINECMADCVPGDQACLQYCMNAGSIQGQLDLNTLIQCLVDNDAQQCPPGDAQCQNNIILNDCLDEYLACFPPGDLNCAEMYACIMACGSDTSCAQTCYSDGAFEAQMQYQDIADCVVDQCGDNPSQTCWEAAQQGACAAVFSACLGS